MSQATVSISKIRENKNALREVDRTTEGYLGLVDSVRNNGVLNPILVRECKDPQTGEEFYGLIDGLHRFTASQDAGLTEIPVHIKSMDDVGVMMAQMMANVHKIETTPVQYSKQLVRILALDPLLTAVQLAGQLSKSPGWLNDRLGLTKLEESIAKLVDDGTINLSNAYALSKLPVEEQPNFLDRALTMSPQEFIPTANQRTKELRDAKRQGRDPNASSVFEPIAHIRKVGEIKDEATSKEAARVLTQDTDNVVDAFTLGVLWVLNLDPISAQAQRDKDVSRKAALKAEQEARKAERNQQKEKEAAEKASRLQSELSAAA